MSRPRTWGADEAGRGPILGPMAIAVVAVDAFGTRRLNRLGVSDSKDFGSDDDGRARRAELAAQIKEVVLHWQVRIVSVDEIDSYTFRGLLNALERRHVHEMLTALGADRGDRVICDGAKLFSQLCAHFPRLRAVDHGESAHVSVAAASILAKDERDRAFAQIAERYAPEFGPVSGGGYCNKATYRFLDAYRDRYGELPPEARKSWGAEKRDANLELF